MRTSWCVPGHTALAYPDLIRRIRDDGHEIVHHGWVHENPASFDEVSVRLRLDVMRSELRVYDPGMHRAAFALPHFVQTLLQLTDRDEPPSVADLRTAGHPLPGVVA